MLQQIIGWCKKMIKVGVQWVENKLLQQTRPSNVVVVVGTAADVVRTRAELIAENALLRQQLVILRRSVKRPKLSDTDLWGSDNSSAAVFPLRPPNGSHGVSHPEPVRR